MKHPSRREVLYLAGATAALVAGIGSHSLALAQAAPTIAMKIVKLAGVVGLAGGRGTLNYNGQAYPLRVGGISIGPGFAIAAYDIVGTVHNLNQVEDIYGNYTAASGGVALVGGAKVAVMSNVRGVRLEVKARTIGIELQLDLSGINISPG